MNLKAALVPESCQPIIAAASDPNPQTYKMLSETEKGALLLLAARSLESSLAGASPPEPVLRTPAMEEPRGAFVTWTIGDTLRGCIGNLESSEPLWVTVQRVAVSAATQDPRFGPIEARELKDLDMDISALTPLEPVTDTSEIRIGTHGLVIRKGARSGVLLPQVASSRGWDVEEFLRNTCLKAGLDEEDWKIGAEIQAFSADVFGQKVAEVLAPEFTESLL